MAKKPTRAKIPKITRAMLRERDVCYDDAQLARLFAGRRHLTPWDICALRIPVADKLWALLHTDALPVEELHQLTTVFVAPVLRSSRLPAGVRAHTIDLLDARRRWLDGELSAAVLAHQARDILDNEHIWYGVSYAVRGCALAAASTAADYSTVRAAGYAQQFCQRGRAAEQLRIVRSVLERVYGPPPVLPPTKSTRRAAPVKLRSRS